MQRKSLFVLCCAAALSGVFSPAFAQTHTSAQGGESERNHVRHYAGLRNVLFAGVPVTAVFTPGQCATSPSGRSGIPAVSGGFVIRDFLEVIDKNIGFSNQHLTQRADGTAVLELVQYRVLPDDSATVTTRFLSPVTYQPLSPAMTFQCAIGRGLEFVVG